MDIKFDSLNVKWQLDKRGLPECLYKIKIPSVSTVLSIIPDPDYDAFVKSVGKEKAEHIMQLAAYRGTAMHKFVENFLQEFSASKDISKALTFTLENSVKSLREENIPDDKIQQGLKMFYAFYYSELVNEYSDIVKIEFPIFSARYYYRGILDILYKNKLAGLTVTDLKSSSDRIKKGSIKEEKYFFQLGGYSLAMEEMYAPKGLHINKASILCIHKNGDFVEEISLMGSKLNEYKEKFKTLVIDYHINNNQSYLISEYIK